MKRKIQLIFNSIPMQAIKQGLEAIIPVLLIGSFALLLKSFPLSGYQSFIKNVFNGQIYNFFELIYVMTFDKISLYMTIAIGYQYSQLKKDTIKTFLLGAPIVSLICFFIISGTASLDGSFGANRMALAIISSLVGASLYCFLSKKLESSIFYNDGVDSRLARVISSVFPMTITICSIALINTIIINIFNVDSIHTLMMDGIVNLFSASGNSMFTGVLFVFVTGILWFFGIHGNNMLEGVCDLIFNPNMDLNEGLIALGELPNQILTKPFFDVFVFVGGCGSAMCLLISIFLFSKIKRNKNVAKLSVVPIVFNVNEIMIFGLPIIFNPTLLIPFICVPLVSFFTSFIAMSLGLVPVVAGSVEWTTPILLGGYLATNSITGSILQLINLVIGVLIYRPFVIRYDRERVKNANANYNQLVNIVKEHEEIRKDYTLINISGELGGIAKTIVFDLQKAIENNEVKLFYQPQYSISGKCIGVEALLRWNHQTFGMIYPPLIFKIAEETNLLFTLEKYIVTLACENTVDILKYAKQDIKISVNVTGISIQDERFNLFLQEVASKYDLKNSLCIELTEQTALKFDENLQKRFENLRKMNFKLAIDDFSMGNTSLQYLKNCHFDMIKIDGGMVQSIIDNENTAKIISSIVSLSKTLGIDVIAEFVSTKEIRDKLDEVGCVIYQGWFYSKAISFEEFREVVERKNC